MNNRKIKSALTPALLGLLFLNSCGNTEVNPKTKPMQFCLDDNFKAKVKISQPQKEKVTEGITLTGSIEANPDKVVPFVSLVDGVISKTYFSLGDRVVKDQVLAEIRSTELTEMQAQFKIIESQIKVATKNLQSKQAMFEDGISSEKDLLEGQSELAVLKAEKEKISSNLNLFSASTEKGVFQIKAAQSGIIISKNITAGTQISAGSEPLFVLADLSDVWVMINIYASNVQHIVSGMEVSIKTISYPDEVFKGSITSITQVLDEEAKVLKARVVLKNKDLRLKPGMIVDVTAQKLNEGEALRIDTASLVFDNNQNFVVVYKGDCEMAIRKITLLAKSNGSSFIATGLNEGESIVSQNQLLIYEQIKNFQQ